MKMSDGKKLAEKLFNQKKAGWEDLDEKQQNEVFNYSNGYIGFLNKGKTEREIVKQAKELAIKNGFKDIAKVKTLKAGDKIFYEN